MYSSAHLQATNTECTKKLLKSNIFYYKTNLVVITNHIFIIKSVKISFYNQENTEVFSKRIDICKYIVPQNAVEMCINKSYTFRFSKPR